MGAEHAPISLKTKIRNAAHSLAMVSRKAAVVAAAIAVALSVAVLLYAASFGGFDFANRVVSDPVEGTATKVADAPAAPPSTNNTLPQQ